MQKVFILDDEKNITLVIEAMLKKVGFDVIVCNRSSLALDLIEQAQPNLVLTDLRMPEIDGMELLRHCKERWPELPVVMMTAFGTIDSAVKAVKLGAFDFVTKPFDQDELVEVVKKAVKSNEKNRIEPSSIVGLGSEKSDLFRMIAKISDSPSTVLITGESGTGKELIAKEIHRRSSRNQFPFVTVNCSAVPENLIESELFGYERGAFTGAVCSKPGRFELADQGTLFLDEIGEMPTDMQAKLLRVLQERVIERVGGVRSTPVDVRVIAATHRDLINEVKRGNFRKDLFYRLNVVPIHIPPLRERRGDIRALVDHFVRIFNQRLGKNIKEVSDACLSILVSLDWPGNVRELENVIERMVLLAEDEILELQDLPEELRGECALSEPKSFKEVVKAQTKMIEKKMIQDALKSTHGNVTHAASQLGLSRKGLQIKLRDLGLR